MEFPQNIAIFSLNTKVHNSHLVNEHFSPGSSVRLGQLGGVILGPLLLIVSTQIGGKVSTTVG